MTQLFVDYWPHYGIIAEAAHIGPNPSLDHCVSFATDNGKELYFGCIYQSWTKVACTMHTAIFDGSKITRNALYHIFYYPYIQLKCERIFSVVPSDNPKALELNHKIGFKDITVVPRAYEAADAVILSMERDGCKWLNYRPRPYEARKVA
jgi:hypothetical protein